MSPLPTHMRDHWSDRVEPAPGHGTVYWHILMSAYPDACAAAADAQEKLTDFPGLHLTPGEWLHITTMIVGSTDQVTQTHMSTMVTEAQRLLSDTAPISVTLSPVLYHPEAIMLGVQPAEALWPIAQVAHLATLKAIEPARAMSEPLSWTPHMTVAYSTTEQPAKPIISSLGKEIQKRQIAINALTLVIQWGPEKLWNWEPIGTARFGA